MYTGGFIGSIEDTEPQSCIFKGLIFDWFKAVIFNFGLSDEILYMGIIDFRGLKNQFSLKYVISGGARNLKGNTRVPIPRLT